MANEYGLMKPYRFSFTDRSNGARIHWIRFYSLGSGIEFALADCKRVLKCERIEASALSIESDQDDAEIRKSWGLPR